MESDTLVPVVDGRANVPYRIFNSSDQDPGELTRNAMKLTYRTDNMGTPVQKVLLAKQSLDVVASVGQAIKVASNVDTHRVAGIYEDLFGKDDVRSGRFEVPGHDPVTDHLIIDALASSKDLDYRIFNSGEHTFNVVIEAVNGSTVATAAGGGKLFA